MIHIGALLEQQPYHRGVTEAARGEQREHASLVAQFMDVNSGVLSFCRLMTSAPCSISSRANSRWPRAHT